MVNAKAKSKANEATRLPAHLWTSRNHASRRGQIAARLPDQKRLVVALIRASGEVAVSCDSG